MTRRRSGIAENGKAKIKLDPKSVVPNGHQPVHSPDPEKVIRDNLKKLSKKLRVEIVDDFDDYVNVAPKTTDGARSVLPEHTMDSLLESVTISTKAEIDQLDCHRYLLYYRDSAGQLCSESFKLSKSGYTRIDEFLREFHQRNPRCTVTAIEPEVALSETTTASAMGGGLAVPMRGMIRRQPNKKRRSKKSESVELDENMGFNKKELDAGNIKVVKDTSGHFHLVNRSAGSNKSSTVSAGPFFSEQEVKDAISKIRNNSFHESTKLDEGAREWVLGALMAMGVLGGIATLNYTDKQMLKNDMQLQTLISYYEDAKREGNKEDMEQLKQRIEDQIAHLREKGRPVLGKDGKPFVPQRHSTTDARKTESVHPVQQVLEDHARMGKPLIENAFRLGSSAFVQVFAEARRLKARGELAQLDTLSEQLLETDIGRWGTYNRHRVPLDVPMISEAEYAGKDVELNKPKRGGNKAYYVYVRNPDTDRVIKVEFGSGMRAKLDDPDARKRYDSRHGCSAGRHNDKTKAGYWSCRLPRYAKALGLSGAGEWW